MLVAVLGLRKKWITIGQLDSPYSPCVTGARKTRWPGKIIGAFALGTKELYRFLSCNPTVELHPASVVNDPLRLGKNYRQGSLNTAVEVDLTG